MDSKERNPFVMSESIGAYASSGAEDEEEEEYTLSEGSFSEEVG